MSKWVHNQVLFIVSILIMLYCVQFVRSLACNCYYTTGGNCKNFSEICESKDKHCYMMLDTNVTHLAKIIVAGCHVFETPDNCPFNISTMHVLKHPSGHYFYCCYGNYCNSVANLNYSQMIQITDGEAVTNYITTTVKPPRGNNEHIIVIISILSALFAFLLICLIVYMTCTKCLHKKFPLSLIDCTQFQKANGAHNQQGFSNEPLRGAMEFTNVLSPTQISPDEMQNVASHCEKVELKAHGRFGNVWLVHLHPPPSTENSSSTMILAAAKIFPQADEQSWKSEVDIYRLPGMKHDNVLSFIGADQVAIGDMQREFWLVTEYQANGSVYDYLQSSSLSWPQMVRIGADMARGLSYLHEEVIIAPTNSHCEEAGRWERKPSIAHRDFKSRNVLLKSDLRACIADLGLSIRFVSGQCLGNFQLQVGTRRYMAPEVLEGAIQFSRDSFLRIDVYAMGLVLWELMSRTRQNTTPGTQSIQVENDDPPAYMAPFEKELGSQPDKDQMCNAVTKQKLRPSPFSYWTMNKKLSYIWDTVEECWDPDAEARLSAGCVAERLENQLASLVPCGGEVEITDPDHRNDCSVSLPLLNHLNELT